MTTRTALISFAIAASALPASAAAGPCDLAVTARPQQLVLGRDYSARIRVETGGARPRLVATTGHVEGLRPDGPSSYIADYFPPRDGSSAAAVVAALVGQRCGFTSLQITGPQAQESPRVAVLLGSDAVQADRQETVPVFVFAASAEGTPASGPPPRLSASLGEVSKLEAVGRGAWRADWRQPPGAPGTASIAALARGEAPVAVKLARAAGPPATVAIELERSQAVAGDPEPIQAMLRILDMAGNPTDGFPAPSKAPEPPTLEVDSGQAGQLVRSSTGTWTAPIYAPYVLPEAREVSIVAQAGELLAKSRIALAPGSATSLLLAFDRAPPPGSGAAGAVVIKATDAFGNPADASEARGQAGRGEVGLPQEVTPGRWVLPYTPPALARDGGGPAEDLVQVRLGELSMPVQVPLTNPSPLVEVAPKLGAAGRSGDWGPAAGVEGVAWFRAMGQQLGVAVDGSWLSFDRSGQVDGLGYSARARIMSLTASGAWRRSIGRDLWIRAVAGGGGAFVQSDTTLAAQPTLTETGWAPTASAAISAGVRSWRGGPFVELRAGWIGNPGLENLDGSLTFLSLSLGYRYDVR